MRHPAEQQMARNMREMVKRTRHEFGFGSIASVRHRASLADLQQLYTPNGRQLRVLAPGNGAEAGDVGKFWFVVGYSIVGGPDIVPEA